MVEIRLQKDRWFYNPDQLIGSRGGFGAVYEGSSTKGNPVAIKKLDLRSEDSAHREFRVASELSGRSLSNVIEVYDSGEDANCGAYFLVMPRADYSLQSELDNGRTFSALEAVSVLKDIANGLDELNGVVHRDLKPANILFQSAQWKIADFGIARFVEESTSLHTLKGCLSAGYAAPEQWRVERSVPATDLYALGCISYRLLAGHEPFPGPTEADYCEQHLQHSAPELPESIPPLLRTLVAMLMRKAPDARPSLTRAKDILNRMSSVPASSESPLAAAAARVEVAQSKAESIAAAQLSREASRENLASSGRSVLSEILGCLRSRILNEAPTCEQQGETLILGQGLFPLPIKYLAKLQRFPEGALHQSKYDVVLATNIAVQQVTPRYAWSSSLLYCKPPSKSDYRWYEVSFMTLGAGNETAPLSLLDGANGRRSYEDLDLALSNTMHIYQAAFGPTVIDDENQEEFIDRWIAIFAASAEGRLKYPTRLPLQPDFWTRLSIYGI